MARIRPAGPEDLAAIRRIAAEAYAHYVARIGREPAPMVADFAAHLARDRVTVLVEDGAVRGYAVLKDGLSPPLLDNIAVDPAAQGKGAGRALVAEIEAHLAACGIRAYELYTHVTMTENIAWYGRLGFVETGRREEDGFARVYMQKRLEGGA